METSFFFNAENAREAMDLADEWLGVPKLLTPEDFVSPNVDEQSMLTYLSQFPNAKLAPGAPLRKKTNAGKVNFFFAYLPIFHIFNFTEMPNDAQRSQLFF